MRHLFVCTNVTSSGKPACGKRGGDAILAAVQQKLLERRATAVLVTACACLGPCFDGPNAVVYPDGIWYGGLTVEDADAIARHLVDGDVYEAKRSEPPG
jgi:(2Fe-2S) ferredoxin